MRKLFEDWNWNDTITFLAILLGVVVITLSLTALCSDHSIKRYYLSGGDNGRLAICKDIDWYPDGGSIALDRSVTYDQAIELVKKLNETIKN